MSNTGWDTTTANTLRGVINGNPVLEVNATGLNNTAIGTSTPQPANFTTVNNTVNTGSVLSLASLSISTALPVASGGTAHTSVTTNPTPSSWAGWDANYSLRARNHVDDLQSIVTSATTAHISNSTPKVLRFTGTLPQIVTLPDVTTCLISQSWYIINRSFNTVLVQTNGGGANVAGVESNNAALFMLNSITDTNDTAWEVIQNQPEPTTVARGSILHGTAVSSLQQLALGTNGQVLSSDGTDIVWAAPTVRTRYCQSAINGATSGMTSGVPIIVTSWAPSASSAAFPSGYGFLGGPTWGFRFPSTDVYNITINLNFSSAVYNFTSKILIKDAGLTNLFVTNDEHQAVTGTKVTQLNWAGHFNINDVIYIYASQTSFTGNVLDLTNDDKCTITINN